MTTPARLGILCFRGAAGSGADPRDGAVRMRAMSYPAPAPDDPLVALTTAPDPGLAEELARRLVEARIAACVQVLPGLVSLYHWQGKVERSIEVGLVVKTVRARLRELEAFLAEHHPYDVPELVVLGADHVGAAYLAWLRAECAAQPPGAET